MSIKNTQDLRKMLIDSIQDVREGKLDPRDAMAISQLSSRVLQSAKLDLDVLKHNIKNTEVGKAGDKVLQLVNS